VLVLDEPLNGLDPMARAETIALFQALAHEGLHVILSSHILHEVDRISDRVVLLSGGYVVAEGEIHGVRSEVTGHPMQVLVRCAEPNRLASRVFACSHVVEAVIPPEGGAVLVRTRDADAFYRLVQRLVVEEGMEIETVAPSDDDVLSLYQYLIGSAVEAS
jgi:ABC-2 type transport system ATP-binding protein